MVHFFWQGSRFHVLAWVVFLAVTLVCRFFLLSQSTGFLDVFISSVYFSIAYLLIFCLFLRYSVWCLSLIWLALPSLLFVIGWLHWYWAVLLLVLWVFALVRAISAESVVHWRPTGSQFVGLVLVLVWVYFSGAGNYGHQSPDYNMHNGRLLDLIRESWPVHFSSGLWVQRPDYGLQHSYLVGYLGYYLPAALVGKVFGEHIAFDFMHVWTLMGCWLALLWLWQLVGRASGLWAAVALLFFGGWDTAGTLVTLYEQSVQFHRPFNLVSISKFFSELHFDTGSMDFWPVSLMGYFFGGYLSNAAELYWSPHQTIAAWVCVGLVLHAFQQGRTGFLLLVYALLAFWSPMNMVTMAVLLLVILMGNGKKGIDDVMTLDNLLAGISMLLLFGVFYLAGSAGTNPLAFVWQKISGAKTWGYFLMFHVLAWGVYAAVIVSRWYSMNKEWQIIAVAAFTGFFTLSLVFYGQYNDLLCRGVTSLQFVLLILLLKHIFLLLEKKNYVYAAIVIFLLIPGVGSGIAHAQRAWIHQEEKTGEQSVADYGDGWEFLGRTDSFFVKHLSKDSAVMTMEKTGRQR